MDSPAPLDDPEQDQPLPSAVFGGGTVLHHADCVDWLRSCPPRSFTAVLTDPPYSVQDFSAGHLAGLRAGRGGVWRSPTVRDGRERAPVPRFTVLRPADLVALGVFFGGWAAALRPALVPGAHVLVAANALLAHRVCAAVEDSGLEFRGTVARQITTLRGGDRPKGAESEFPDVTVMPRGAWEPWLLFREPFVGRGTTAAANLREFGAGGLRRDSPDRPFTDLVVSAPAGPVERALSLHPNLKPQAFLRHMVRALLPLGTGVLFDPFAGSGSALAAGLALGVPTVGVERDPEFHAGAVLSVPRLARFAPGDAEVPQEQTPLW